MGFDSSQIRLNDLIGLLYDAALEESLWDGIAQRIGGALDCTSTVVKLHGGDGGVRLLQLTPNMIVPDHLKDWAAYWHARDLWVERSVSVGLSKVVTSDDLVSAEERPRSDFYQEWLPALDIYHMIGGVFPVEGGAVGILGMHRPHDAPGFTRKDRRAVALLLPHLRRALDISQRIGHLSAARHVSMESLDRVDSGVVLTRADGRIVHINRAANAMIGSNRDLDVKDGRLLSPRADLHARLMGAIRHAADPAGDRGCDPPVSFRLEREGRHCWSLSVSPMQPRSTLAVTGQSLALVLMRDPEYPPYLIEQLRDMFGFTRMEALTAAELARGQALTDIAASLSVGLGTVRTHLKQVLLKTDTRRQAEAVVVIARSVATMPLSQL